MIDDRPAFVQVIELKSKPCISNGYILLINDNNHGASIIILNKRRDKSMVKTVVKALEGFEDIFGLLNDKKANLDARKDEAIKVAIAEVEERFAEYANRIDKALAEVSVTEEIEVPDEVEVHEDVTIDATENVSTDDTIIGE